MRVPCIAPRRPSNFDHAQAQGEACKPHAQATTKQATSKISPTQQLVHPKGIAHTSCDMRSVSHATKWPCKRTRHKPDIDDRILATMTDCKYQGMWWHYMHVVRCCLAPAPLLSDSAKPHRLRWAPFGPFGPANGHVLASQRASLPKWHAWGHKGRAYNLRKRSASSGVRSRFKSRLQLLWR